MSAEQLLQEKQEITQRCRDLVDEIKREEHETARVLKALRAENAEEIKTAHETWSEGE